MHGTCIDTVGSSKHSSASEPVGGVIGLLQGGDTASLQEFGSLFDDIKFRKGLQLNFTSASNGHLIAQIDDRQVRLDGFNTSTDRPTSEGQTKWPTNAGAACCQ